MADFRKMVEQMSKSMVENLKENDGRRDEIDDEDFQRSLQCRPSEIVTDSPEDQAEDEQDENDPVPLDGDLPKSRFQSKRKKS